MAAYQCLNCHEIERSGEDCCENPDLFCINDMPAEIVRLRAALERALGCHSATIITVPFGATVVMIGGGGGGGNHAASPTKDGGGG